MFAVKTWNLYLIIGLILLYIFDIRILFGSTIVTHNIKLYAILLYAHAIALEC